MQSLGANWCFSLAICIAISSGPSQSSSSFWFRRLVHLFHRRRHLLCSEPSRFLATLLLSPSLSLVSRANLDRNWPLVCMSSIRGTISISTPKISQLACQEQTGKIGPYCDLWDTSPLPLMWLSPPENIATRPVDRTTSSSRRCQVDKSCHYHKLTLEPDDKSFGHGHLLAIIRHFHRADPDFELNQTIHRRICLSH